jgi:hypothetical protein
MTKLKLSVGAIMLGLGAIAFLTNPGQQKYRQYADNILRTELQDRVCTQVSEDLAQWLESQCYILVSAASPYLAEVVIQQTTRHNFLLFSIYQADLPLPSPLPTYHLETLGILGNFYTYRAKKL